jgi:hypothetical protein
VCKELELIADHWFAAPFGVVSSRVFLDSSQHIHAACALRMDAGARRNRMHCVGLDFRMRDDYPFSAPRMRMATHATFDLPQRVVLSNDGLVSTVNEWSPQLGLASYLAHFHQLNDGEHEFECGDS